MSNEFEKGTIVIFKTPYRQYDLGIIGLDEDGDIVIKDGYHGGWIPNKCECIPVNPSAVHGFIAGYLAAMGIDSNVDTEWRDKITVQMETPEVNPIKTTADVLNHTVCKEFEKHYQFTGNKIHDIKAFRLFYQYNENISPSLRASKNFVESVYDYPTRWFKES